jgi:hypothetical protein
MEAGFGSPAGWLFFAAVVGLFAWGITLGIAGLRAPHMAHRRYGRRPGAPAAFDWRWMEQKRDLYRVA